MTTSVERPNQPSVLADPQPAPLPLSSPLPTPSTSTLKPSTAQPSPGSPPLGTLFASGSAPIRGPVGNSPSSHDLAGGGWDVAENSESTPFLADSFESTPGLPFWATTRSTSPEFDSTPGLPFWATTRSTSPEPDSPPRADPHATSRKVFRYVLKFFLAAVLLTSAAYTGWKATEGFSIAAGLTGFVGLVMASLRISSETDNHQDALRAKERREEEWNNRLNRISLASEIGFGSLFALLAGGGYLVATYFISELNSEGASAMGVITGLFAGFLTGYHLLYTAGYAGIYKGIKKCRARNTPSRPQTPPPLDPARPGPGKPRTTAATRKRARHNTRIDHFAPPIK